MISLNDVVHGAATMTVPIGEGRDKTYIKIEAGEYIVAKENTKEGRATAFEEVWSEVGQQLNQQITETIADLKSQLKGE